MIKAVAVSLMSVVLTSACGGGGDDDSNDTPNEPIKEPKKLFSLWKEVNDGTPVDLTQAQFNFPITLFNYWPGGEICQYTAMYVGDNVSGVFSFNDAYYLVGTGGGIDPGCHAWSLGLGEYEIKDDLLTTCRQGFCLTYE